MSARPILVTGSHRSGTTFTGRLLGLSGEALPIHEPFNPGYERSWLKDQPTTWFQYIDAETDDRWSSQLRDVVELRPPVATILRRKRSLRHGVRVAQESVDAFNARRRGMRALLKDPIAFFAASWFHEEFDADVLVLVRHPAAFASSLKRLTWSFEFDNLVRQDRLMAHLPPELADEVIGAAASPLDIIDTSILMWRVINGAVSRMQREQPSIVVRRYEDLADDALGAFESLYAELGLTWSADVAQQVRSFTDQSNTADVADGDKGGVARDSKAAMWTWKDRLERDEVSRVRAGTADVATEFYTDADWDPPAS